MATSDYDKTAANNTSISGINIAEGCAPSGINNAIRTLLADLANAMSWVVKTTTYTAVNHDKILADTVTTSAFSITLPLAPSAGDVVTVGSGSDWSSNNLTINRNSETIRGTASNLTLSDAGNVHYKFVYDGTTWQYYSGTDYGSLSIANTWTGVQTFDKVVFGSDANFNADIISSDPRITFDGTDYLDYTRSSNAFRFVIGGAVPFSMNASGLLLGGTGTRVASFGDLAGKNLADANAWTGVQTFDKAEFGSDTNFNADIVVSDPRITFDTGSDYVDYVRSSDSFRIVIGGSVVSTINSSGLLLGGAGTRVASFGTMAAETATNYGKLADANAWTGVQTFDKAEFGSDSSFHADLISTNPTITMDGSDLFVYNRSATQFRFEIAGTLEADINASGLRLGSGGTRVNQFGDLATSSLSDGLVFSGTVEVPTSTVAGVPTATAGRIAYISDESGGAVLAFADGTNWRRSTDRAIVS